MNRDDYAVPNKPVGGKRKGKMPYPSGSGRRAPPPPPPDDNPVPSDPTDIPPPLPARPQPTSEKPPEHETPPPLPSRRGQVPPPGNATERNVGALNPEEEYLTPVAVAEDEYEDMRPAAIPPSPRRKEGVVNLPHGFPASVESTPLPPLPLGSGDSSQEKPNKKSVKMWDSFRDLGQKLHLSGRGKPDTSPKKPNFTEPERKISVPASLGQSKNSDTKLSDKQRRQTVGGGHRQQPMPKEEFDDTYEEPTTEPKLPPRGVQKPGMTSFVSIKPADDDHFESDDGWSDSEFDDTAAPDPQPAPQPSDNTYEVPEGGAVKETDELDYIIADAPKLPPSVVKKPPPNKPAIRERTLPLINNADIQISKKNLSTATPAPIPDKPKLPQQNGAPAKSIADRKNMFEKTPEKDHSSRPTPPAKPQKALIPNIPKPPSKREPPQLPVKLVGELEGPKLPPRPNKSIPPVLPSDAHTVGKHDRNVSDDSASSCSAGSLPGVNPSDKSPGPFLQNHAKVQVLPTGNGFKQALKKVSPDLPPRPGAATKPPHIGASAVATASEELYSDGLSEDLSRYDWFHGEIQREDGGRRVRSLSENGAFLIRASKQDGASSSHPYTLVVISDHKVYNLKIRLRDDARFAIGTYKADEVSFADVPELVEHHRENNIKLAEGGKMVKLTRAPKK